MEYYNEVVQPNKTSDSKINHPFFLNWKLEYYSMHFFTEMEMFSKYRKMANCM